MAVAPWVVSEELWGRVEPLLPRVGRRFRYPGRKRLPDREALQGILFVLQTGIAWRHLPLELGFGGGSTCYRRLDEWQRAGVWERLHALLLSELRAAGEIEWSRAVADSSHVQAKCSRLLIRARSSWRRGAVVAETVGRDGEKPLPDRAERGGGAGTALPGCPLHGAARRGAAGEDRPARRRGEDERGDRPAARLLAADGLAVAETLLRAAAGRACRSTATWTPAPFSPRKRSPR